MRPLGVDGMHRPNLHRKVPCLTGLLLNRMSSRPTLHKLAEDVIRELRAPFSADDFVVRLKERWQRKIADTTLHHLKQKLAGHESLIEIRSNDYLPYQAVLKKIQDISLAVSLRGLEVRNRIFIPGYRVMPFVSNDLSEEELVLLDPEGREIPKFKKSFYLENVIEFYRYSGDRYFPDKITINEWLPGKSSVSLTVWDMKRVGLDLGVKRGGRFRIRLVDYERGVFKLESCCQREYRDSRLKRRSLYVAMEAALVSLCAEKEFSSFSLEKQLMRVFYDLDEKLLDIPAFSLLEFLESLKTLGVVGYEDGGPRLVWVQKTESHSDWEPVPQTPTGQNRSLDEIFEDLGFPFSATEFKAIMNTTADSEKHKTSAVLDLLFGGKDDRFCSRKQRNAFYRHLRKLLLKIFHEEKDLGPRFVSELREKVVAVKLSLVKVLRFLEANEVGLADIPGEVLEQIADLDHFCSEILPRFADRSHPPDLKTISDIRLALKFILPNLVRLEEDVYHRLGIE